MQLGFEELVCSILRTYCQFLGYIHCGFVQGCEFLEGPMSITLLIPVTEFLTEVTRGREGRPVLTHGLGGHGSWGSSVVVAEACGKSIHILPDLEPEAGVTFKVLPLATHF